MAVFVGIDGGGTRATALVIDAEGVVLGRAHGGPALVSAVAPTARADALAALATEALAQAATEQVAAVMCCAVAGVGREPERAALEAALRSIAPARDVFVTTDAEAALYDAFGDQQGILLIAGTGSIAWGRGADGRLARCGGWGHILGDEGSGYAIGRAGLRAVMHAHDGRA